MMFAAPGLVAAQITLGIFTVLTLRSVPMVAASPGDVFEARIEGLGSVRAVFGRSTEDA